MRNGKRNAAGAALLLALTAGTAFASFGEQYGPGNPPPTEAVEILEPVVTGEKEAESGEPAVSGTEAADSELQENQNKTVTKNSPAHPGSFQVDRFVLPKDAKVLVVVEGTGGSSCNVYAFEYKAGETAETPGTSGAPERPGIWELKFSTPGYLGRNGMNNYRVEGDKTTPIGLFQLNTPFGQAAPLEGFPENYIQVGESHVWSSKTNVLTENPAESGERVGTAGYSEYYDYVLDCGYNKKAFPKKGSALFIHCHGHGRTETSGCVSIPKELMAELMRLYGAYGDGHCYIAQAPKGTFDMVYDTYGINNGLSPDGDFGI